MSSQSVDPNDYRIDVAIGSEAVLPAGVAQALGALGAALAEAHGDVTGHVYAGYNKAPSPGGDLLKGVAFSATQRGWGIEADRDAAVPAPDLEILYGGMRPGTTAPHM